MQNVHPADARWKVKPVVWGRNIRRLVRQMLCQTRRDRVELAIFNLQEKALAWGPFFTRSVRRLLRFCIAESFCACVVTARYLADRELSLIVRKQSLPSTGMSSCREQRAFCASNALSTEVSSVQRSWALFLRVTLSFYAAQRAGPRRPSVRRRRAHLGSSARTKKSSSALAGLKTKDEAFDCAFGDTTRSWCKQPQ